jgi:DUF4097 and DUF4098 domain-containing protein YvlB
MKTMHIKLAVLGLGLGQFGLAQAEGVIEELRDMDADGHVIVSNVAGDIDITTWDRDQVEIYADVGDGSELEITETSGGIRIEVTDEDDDGHWGRDFEETDIRLKVPVGASISAEGVSSDITISGSRGAEITAESVSGDVEVDADVQKLDLSSVSGDVDFKGTSPRTSAETVSGDVDLDGVDGELSVSLVSGDVELQAGVLSRGNFDSVSGTLELELEMAPGGRLTVESMSGDVILHLPGDQASEIRAQTFSGDIRSEFGSTQKASTGPGSHLEYTSGGDGATIRVESFSGDIQIGHK